jgi:hypothetical protein
MFEHKSQPLLSPLRFLRRITWHGVIAIGLLVGSLSIGLIGYHFTEGLPWLDALVNASMILGGMGPVDALHTCSGKVFASLYALFSGVVFLIVVVVALAPWLHRIFHRFHLDEPDNSQ